MSESASIRRALVFPGQGSAGGEINGEVAEAVRQQVGDGDTPYQLAVFANSVSLLGELRESGVIPDVVAGHSLGEYAAAHAAGSLGLFEAVRLVAERDRLMNEASVRNAGGMVALIGADPREVSIAVEEFPEEKGIAVTANFNTPRQTVISGEIAALEEIGEGLRGKKVKLPVAGAFHSPLMMEAALQMERLLDEVQFRDPEVPMVSAADGAVLSKADDARLALREQMLSPVRWVAVIQRFLDLGVEEIVEVGADGTLTRMLRDFKEERLTGRAAKEVLA